MTERVRSILEALAGQEGRPSGGGVRVEAGRHGPAEEIERARLHDLACAAGAFFRRFGVDVGDRIVTFLPTGRPLLQSIFGAWTVGAVVCVIAPSIDGGRSSLSSERVAEMLRIARPRVVVVDECERAALGAIAEEIGAVLVAAGDLPLNAPDATFRLHHSALEEPALIQFTSGTTGVPKGVVVEHGQLIENALVSADWIGFTASDVFVSWLPIHHDFGFVVGLTMPILMDARLALIPSETFSRQPLNWLRVLSEERAKFSASPPSALAPLCREVFARRAAGLDLSSLRCVLLGAEPISPALCDAFETIYAACNLRPNTLCPAYGMAETTLGMTCRSLDSPRRTTRVLAEPFHRYGRVVHACDTGATTLALLSNGPPLPGVRIRIVDDAGAEITEGGQGRILVSSSMVTRRYFGLDEPPQRDGWFDTGDLGFVLDGEIYVTGRSKDVIVRGGVNMPAHLIEAAVLSAFPDVVSRTVAFAVPNNRDLRDEVIVGVELRRVTNDPTLPTAIRTSVQGEIDFQIDRVVMLPKGAIPYTTSGKPQRSRAKELYRRGKIALVAEESAR